MGFHSERREVIVEENLLLSERLLSLAEITSACSPSFEQEQHVSNKTFGGGFPVRHASWGGHENNLQAFQNHVTSSLMHEG
jgi:hypothetical protein